MLVTAFTGTTLATMLLSWFTEKGKQGLVFWLCQCYCSSYLDVADVLPLHEFSPSFQPIDVRFDTSFRYALDSIAKTIPTERAPVWLNWIIFRIGFTLTLGYLFQLNTFLTKIFHLKWLNRVMKGGYVWNTMIPAIVVVSTGWGKWTYLACYHSHFRFLFLITIAIQQWFRISNAVQVCNTRLLFPPLIVSVDHCHSAKLCFFFLISRRFTIIIWSYQHKDLCWFGCRVHVHCVVSTGLSVDRTSCPIVLPFVPTDPTVAVSVCLQTPLQ